MRNILSRYNQKRLFIRHERKANERASGILASLSEQDRSEILELMSKFRPLDCGKELVRVGPKHDGGYLLPNDFEGIAALYSPGVDETIGFDLDIANRGIPCFLADGTVNKPVNLAPNMQFKKMMIGSGPADSFMTMQDWVDCTSPGNSDLMLQMDIEGAELDVLAAMPRKTLDRFRIIALELHSVEWYLLGSERQKFSDIIGALTLNHIICHLHPNTVAAPVQIFGRHVPPLLELTLLRKDRLTGATKTDATYPHRLDSPNSAHLPLRDYPPFW